MASTISTDDYIGNDSLGGSNTDGLSFAFKYIKQEDVKVSLNGAVIPADRYTFPTTNTIKFRNLTTSEIAGDVGAVQQSTGAPKDGVTILIHRRTDTNSAHAVYSAGSPVRASDLNTNADQLLFFAQECADTANPLITDISGFTVDETGKVDGSLVYYDGSAQKFKSDDTTTKTTIVDGGSYT